MGKELPYQPEPPKLSPEAWLRIQQLMEEMAGMPTEEMGKRQPGERCMYEIERKKDA